ncbi:hypothetical protein L2E82_02701 [Cichorium intybus]|uniref:Uncharacterized protein n=1 Tax=Cichorium intybus TaxID=13427 RepID=A0ACB9H3P7_CICIN|nr:hypothetical protein L2E82_02701 [Cichorium intybus]
MSFVRDSVEAILEWTFGVESGRLGSMEHGAGAWSVWKEVLEAWNRVWIDFGAVEQQTEAIEVEKNEDCPNLHGAVSNSHGAV